MAFGDKGNRRVLVNGVPFRVDAETYEEAQQKVRDMLETEPRLFDMRAQALGLDANDVEAMQLAAEKGQAALRGVVRAEDSVTSPTNKFLVGSGRSFVNRWRGARQGIAQLFGDEAAAKAIAQEDADERGLYQQLDDAGVGLEDLGEIGTDIGLFLGATTLTGGGAVPMFITGAALGASDVKDEVRVPGALQGETQLEGGRMMDAAVGGAAALLGPAARLGKQAVGGLVSRIGPAASVRMSPGLWLRARALMGNPEAMANIVDDGLRMTAEGADPAKTILGRAALDKVQQILARLPATEARGLKDAAALGVLRNAVKKATQTGADGVNVFNPAVFEKEATTLIGQLPNIFTKPEHQLMAASLGQLAKAMQALPGGLSPTAAERAASALVSAQPSTEAVLKALNTATNPDVKRMLLDALADHGSVAISNLRQSIMPSAVAGASENVATEGSEDIEEVIGGRQRARRDAR